MIEEIQAVVEGLKAVEAAGKRAAGGLEVLVEAAKNAGGGEPAGHR